MTKKREIKVFISYEQKRGCNYFYTVNDGYSLNDLSSNFQKATLIIEEPEPEITITPSRLREAISTARKKELHIGEDTEAGYLIKELFGDKL